MTERPESATGAGHTRQPLRSRLLALVLHPTAPPLRWGIVVALAFIVGESLLVLHLKRMAPGNAFGAIFLLGVLVVSAGWSFGLALATSLASAAVYVYFHLEGGDSIVPALFVFLPLALLANVLAGQARLRAAESEQRRREAATLARQQAALRTVATLVARGADPAEVYPVAVTELAHGSTSSTSPSASSSQTTSSCWPGRTVRIVRISKWESTFRLTAIAWAPGFGEPAAARGSTTTPTSKEPSSRVCADSGCAQVSGHPSPWTGRRGAL